MRARGWRRECAGPWPPTLAGWTVADRLRAGLPETGSFVKSCGEAPRLPTIRRWQTSRRNPARRAPAPPAGRGRVPAVRGALRQGRLPGSVPRALVPVRLRVRGVGPHVRRLHAEGLRGRDRPRPAPSGEQRREGFGAVAAKRPPLPMCRSRSRRATSTAPTSSAAGTRSSTRRPSRGRASASSRASALGALGRGAQAAAMDGADALQLRCVRPCPSGPGGVSSTAGSPCSFGWPRNVRSLLPSSPSPIAAWRSRLEPSGAAASFTCSARRRSRPMRSSSPASVASTTAASVTSTPETQRWQVSRQTPRRSCCRARRRARRARRSSGPSCRRRRRSPRGSSQVVSEGVLQRLLERRHRSLEPGLEARAAVRAHVQDDAVGLDRDRCVHRLQHGVEALAVDRLVRRREVDEVERVDEGCAEAGLGARVAECLEVLRIVLGKSPHARRLDRAARRRRRSRRRSPRRP